MQTHTKKNWKQTMHSKSSWHTDIHAINLQCKVLILPPPHKAMQSMSWLQVWNVIWTDTETSIKSERELVTSERQKCEESNVSYVLWILRVYRCLDYLARPGLLPERVGSLAGEAHQQAVRHLLVQHELLWKIFQIDKKKYLKHINSRQSDTCWSNTNCKTS